VPNPDDLVGRSEAEVARSIPDDWKASATRKGGGMRYADPGNPGTQVRVMPGNPNDPNPVKQGSYARVSTGGMISDQYRSKAIPLFRRRLHHSDE
jgi:hypothetical protein